MKNPDDTLNVSNQVNTSENNDRELLLQQQEYDDYRKSLIFIRECPACYYAQAMILLGISFFSIVRMQFLWSSLNKKQVFGYSSICLITAILGSYRMSYAYHIFQIQGRVKKYKNI